MHGDSAFAPPAYRPGPRDAAATANLVKLFADRVEFPLLRLQYSLTPPVSKLQDGLAAYQALKLDFALQSLPRAERQEVTRFLRQFGRLLFRTLFTAEAYERLNPRAPLLLELGLDWAAYPWELLNDGERWLSLNPGVLRYLFHPEEADARAPAAGEPLRVLAASARPLPGRPDSPLARQMETLGSRFVSVFADLADGPEERAPGHALRLLEHAGRAELESALGLGPEVLLFSGFASEQGWYLESDLLTAQAAAWDWLVGLLRKAAHNGLGLLVLNDAPGLNAPMTAASQTRALLRAGLPALVRIEGRQARLREQDYLRTLLRYLGSGATVHDSHLAGVRRLYRRFEDGWDWSFVRLYQRSFPAAGDYRLPSAEPEAALLGRPASVRPVARATLRAFESAPAPPLFASRRRFFGRETELQRLAEALQPDPEQKSPLVFLHGPAGSGKTMLALELARRLQRRFVLRAYLHARDLAPEPGEVVAVEGLSSNGHPAEWPLVKALARHLAAPALAAEPPEGWKAALRVHCEDGAPRLIIVDRLEHLAGYEAFCEGLAGLPRTCRVLVLSRGQPPLLPGAAMGLEPATTEALGRMLGGALRERLEAFPDGSLLEQARQDLFLARLLRRARAWPTPQEVSAALEDEPGGPEAGSPAGRLVLLMAERALAGLGDEARRLLRVLALFPALVHRELASLLAEVEGPALSGAITELQWCGLIDCYDGERYLALHPRVHGAVGQRLLSRTFLAQIQTRLLRAYQTYLAGLGALKTAGGGWPKRLPGLTAWGGHPPASCTAAGLRDWHRLGVERVNLAELAAMLAEDGDWRAVERLATDAAVLEGLPGLEDVWHLLNHCLMAAAEARRDTALQAQALNRLARPLLEAGTGGQRAVEQARDLLERALDLLAHTTGWRVLGETYRLLSECYERLGSLDAALNLLYSAVELAQQLGDADGLVQACTALQRIWERRGEDSEQAERFLRPRIQYLRQNGHGLQAALLERLAADALSGGGRDAEALDAYQAVLNETRRLEDTRQAALTLLRLAGHHAARERAEAAYALWQRAGEEHPEAGDPGQQRAVLETLCRLFEQAEQPARALDAYLRLRSLLEAAEARESLIAVLDRIGGLYYQMGEQAKSTQCYEERLQLQAALSPP